MEIVDTLKNGYKIIQNSEMFKFGIDAVLLSYFAFNQIRNNEKIIDLGTGNGIIPLLLAKSRAKTITGLEIQKENVEIAKEIKLGNITPAQDLIFSFNVKEKAGKSSAFAAVTPICSPEQAQAIIP